MRHSGHRFWRRRLLAATGLASGPAFWRGAFTLGETGDTFLDMSNWGQGIVWINGCCLGRYWSIGPTQTMYLPGPWMRRERNDVVVLDLTGQRSNRIGGLRLPILDQLRPENDLAGPVRRVQAYLTGVAPTHEGQFAPGAATQEVLFAQPAAGRQFCLEALGAFDGKPFAAMAEIALLDTKGQPINQSSWTIAYASSEDGSVLNAINGQVSDHWHTAHSGKPPHPAHPHRLIIDLGVQVELAGARYTPRQGASGVTGRIWQYRMYVGNRLAREP